MKTIKIIILTAIITASLSVAGQSYAALIYPTIPNNGPIKNSHVISSAEIKQAEQIPEKTTQSIKRIEVVIPPLFGESNVKTVPSVVLTLQEQIDQLNKRVSALENKK